MILDALTILGVLNTILIGLSGWTLYTLHTLANSNAAQLEKDIRIESAIKENRVRIIRTEDDVRSLQLDMAALNPKPRQHS